MLLNYSRRQLNALGGEFQLDVEGGTDQRVAAEWFQPLNYASTLFAAPSAGYQSELQNYFSNDVRVAEYEITRRGGGLDLGSQFYEWGELRGGVYYGAVDRGRKTGSEELPGGDDIVAAWTLRFTLDRLDDAVFPTKGFFLQANGFFADEHLGSDNTYQKMWSGARFVKSIGRHTFAADGGAGHSFDSDVPVYDQFALGGFGSIPGLAPGQLRGPYYVQGGLGYRFKLGQLSPTLGDGVYYIARVGAGNVWQDTADIELDDMLESVATGLGADTALGPLLVGVGLAEGEQLSYFLSIGTTF